MDINIKNTKVKDIIKIGNALSNSHRRKILQYCANGNYAINEVKKKIDLTYANVHKHIKTLKEAGLVSTKEAKDKRGRIVLVKSLYEISNDGILKKI